MKNTLLKSLAAGTAIGAASSLALYFTLQSGFDDLDKVLDGLEQSVQEMVISTDKLLQSNQELNQTLDQEIAAMESARKTRPAQVLNLCNNNLWGYNLCENLVLSNGTVLSVERDKASKHLIETVDGIRSGKKESAFEAPLPAEEADQLLLYNTLG